MTAPQDPFSTPPQGTPGSTPSGYGTPAAPPSGYGAPPGAPPAYGTAPAGYGAPGGPPGFGGQPQNGLGIASLVLGILALVSGLFIIGGVFGVVAVVLGVLALGKVKKGLANNRGMALAGIITGALGILLTILVIAGAAALFNSDDVSNLRECLTDAGGDSAKQEQCQQDFSEEITN